MLTCGSLCDLASNTGRSISVRPGEMIMQVKKAVLGDGLVIPAEIDKEDLKTKIVKYLNDVDVLPEFPINYKVKKQTYKVTVTYAKTTQTATITKIQKAAAA